MIYYRPYFKKRTTRWGGGGGGGQKFLILRRHGLWKTPYHTFHVHYSEASNVSKMKVIQEQKAFANPVKVKVNPLKFRFMESLCHTAIFKVI